jgi:hypothetical protein
VLEGRLDGGDDAEHDAHDEEHDYKEGVLGHGGAADPARTASPRGSVGRALYIYVSKMHVCEIHFCHKSRCDRLGFDPPTF